MPVPQEATTALPAPRPDDERPSEAAKPYTPAKTMEATTAAKTSFVVLLLYRIFRMSILLWSRFVPAGPLSGDQRIGERPMNPGVREVCASYEPECPEKGARGSDRDRGVAPAHFVDEPGQAFGELWILKLEHVLGVQLAGVGEIEAAHEDGVVGHGHLRMHVVVHRARGVRRRDLAREGCAGERRTQKRRLPLRVAVLVPLLEHLCDLGGVDHAGEVDLPVRGDLRERSEDRRRADHRRGDPDPPPGRADRLRDPVCELITAARAEPGAHAVHRRGVDLAAAVDLARRPELLEVLAVTGRDRRRVDGQDHVLLPLPR